MLINDFNPTGTDGGGGEPPPPVTTPKGGGNEYLCFEVGLGEECQLVQRLVIGDKTYKAVPVASGPIALDIDAKNGGKVRIFQVDELGLLGVRFQQETWDFKAGDRKIKGLAPTRRFVVIALTGDELKVQPRSLGWATRGPSVWKLSPKPAAWTGV